MSDLTKEINYIIGWYSDRHDAMDTWFGISPSAIHSVHAESRKAGVYTLDGRKAGAAGPKQRGIYIVGGRKVLLP